MPKKCLSIVTRKLIYFQNISPVIFDGFYFLPTVDFLSFCHPRFLFDRILQHLRNIRNRPCLTISSLPKKGRYRSAKIETALLAYERIDDLGQVPTHEILDINFLWLISRKREAKKSDNPRIPISLPFLSVPKVRYILWMTIQVFFPLMTTAHVQKHRPNFPTHRPRQSTFLHERTEGRKTRSETSHDNRCRVVGR
jgi:hypothetical protein